MRLSLPPTVARIIMFCGGYGGGGGGGDTDVGVGFFCFNAFVACRLTAQLYRA